MKSPFKFLDAYELKDRAVFFGREEEIEALYGLVFKTPLLLLYGLSGTGKTSLIRCGLASRFSAPNWYPFFIRRGEDLNESIRLALGNALPPGKTLPETLPEQVSLLFRNYLRPVYLIFDQFEELFILGKKEEQLAFARSIRALLDAELPCKILMVMREEFIGQLYYLEKEIPGIYDFRLRVEPMGLKKVQEVISGSLQHFQVRVPDTERNIERMYNNISVGKSGVQLPHLQVYLDMFWREDFARTYPAAEQVPLLAGMAAEPSVYPPLEFTPEEIDNFGNIESVLARFLAEQERSLQAELRQQFGTGIPDQAVRQVLDLFVSEQGTKKPRLYRRDEQGLHLADAAEQLLCSSAPPP
ncbi:MAG: ATP-binding protein [Haliscomenobacter sp.]|nr:ATP-binding protein [Haliscomenobacter sp.]MBK9492738.1 ATP-binding protein [Haliscomenobacter sp.]